MVLLWCVSELIDGPLLGESASPFIDEGDGLTSVCVCVRERVRRLLSLVAHDVGYKMMVGAHNIVVVRRMWEVVSSYSGMADVGACHTVDAQRHVGVPYHVCLA